MLALRVWAETYARWIARALARADEIRDALAERGVVLEDTAQGTRWKQNA